MLIMCVCSLSAGRAGSDLGFRGEGVLVARSTEFLGLPFMQALRWMRVPGDTIFAIAALVLVAFVFIGRQTAVSEAKESADVIRVPAGD